MIEALPCGAADPQTVCNVPGRRPRTSDEEAAVDDWKRFDPDAHLECFCAIEQVAHGPSGAMEACQLDLSPSPVTAAGEPVDGYCLLDALEGVGDPTFFSSCESGEPDLLRFVGEGRPRSGAEVLVTCVTEQPRCWGE